MRVNEMEVDILQRVDKEGWTLDPNKDLRSLTEEVGELAREIRRFEDGRERPDEVAPNEELMKEEIASEIGDILFPLTKIAAYYGINLEGAYKAHQKKMESRYNANGKGGAVIG